MIKKTIILTTIYVFMALFCTACSMPTGYEATGEVIDVECDNKSKFHSSSIELDNGVTYHSKSAIGCSVSEGVEVVVIHNSEFQIRELIVSGTVKRDKD